MEEYKLIHPVQFGSEKIEVLKVQRPKGRHIQDMPASPKLWDFIIICSKCSGISIEAFKEMDGEDLLAIGGLMGKFWASSQVTGS
jgi:hypothetical protein